MKHIIHLLVLALISTGALYCPSEAQAGGFAADCAFKFRLHFASRSLARAKYVSESKAVRLETELVYWISARSIGLELVPENHLVQLVRNIRKSVLVELLLEQRDLYFQMDPTIGSYILEQVSPRRVVITLPTSNEFTPQFLAALGKVIYPTVAEEMPSIRTALLKDFPDAEPSNSFGMTLAAYLTNQALLQSLAPSTLDALLDFFKNFRTNEE